MQGLLWERLGQVFTAEVIMTPRDQLLTRTTAHDLSALAQVASNDNFDLVPLTEEDRIIAVFAHGERFPVSDSWLVSRDTALPDLLELFVESERPGFLVLHRQNIVGLVTPSDFNKVPARVFIYNVIGELEITLASAVRTLSSDSDALLSLLSDERAGILRDEMRGLERGNAELDMVQLLSLADLVNLVAKHEELRSLLGFASRRAAEGTLNSLVDLRNQTMHLVRPLIERMPDDVLKLHRRLKIANSFLMRSNDEPQADGNTTL